MGVEKVIWYVKFSTLPTASFALDISWVVNQFS